MSEPQRRQVRVRRSPKISVFLLLGAVVGALVAVVAANLAPPDPATPTSQAIGFLLVLLAPLGGAIGGVIALVLDRIAEHRSKIVDAELTAPPAPVVVEPVEPVEATEPQESEPEADQRR